MIENNPKRYRELSAPWRPEEAEQRLTDFFKELMELRVKHGVPDVLMVVRITQEIDDELVPALSFAHMGDETLLEGMAGWMFARAGEERRLLIDRMKAAGVRAAKR